MSFKIKTPSFNQWVQSFKAFTLIEKVLFLIFFIAFVSSVIFSINSFYNKNTETVPAQGGSFKEGLIGQPKHINPIYSPSSDVDKDLVELVYSSLVKYGENGEIENDLIENYSFSNDGKTFDFKIKENVFWHDKEKLTLDDIAFTLNIVQDAEYLSPLRASFLGITLEKMSDYEGRFKLSEAYGGFLENLITLKIIPKHIFENIPAQNFASDENINLLSPIGSGPYKIYKVKKNGSVHSIQLRANNNYYDGKPYVKDIYFYFYSSEEELENALLKGQIDNAHLSSKIDYPNISLITPNYFGIFLNTKNEILENSEIRTALSLAIDRDKILNEILLGEGYSLSSPILSPFYGLEDNKINQNIEESISILENNDYELNEENIRVQSIEKVNNENISQDLVYGSSGVQVRRLQECLSNFPEIYESQKITSYFGEETKTAVIKFQETYADEILTPNNLTSGNGKVGLSTRTKLNELCYKGESTETKLEFTLKTTNYSILSKVAENIKNDLAQIGVKVNIETYDNTQIKQIIRERNYDMILFGEKLMSMPNLLPYFHSSQIFDPGLNLSVWQNEDADNILEKIRLYYNFNEELISDLKSFEEIFFEENPAILLYSPNYIYYVSDKIKGFSTNKLITPSQRFSNITKLYIETKKVWK
ncbi:MAG: ABC transporter substrate-binding protein [Candidatus Pacebacteria bacterium]|nr:ABC transporter substrate-binding protein [Candidatus Paceibacterota bacterium]